MELGWIDFSKTERSKILSVLDLLSESGTLDELGIAPVRDGFSNLFFPGTTTIQGRLGNSKTVDRKTRRDGWIYNTLGTRASRFIGRGLCVKA